MLNGFDSWETPLYSFPNKKSPEGFYTYFTKNNEVYISFYLLDSHRGKGVFNRFLIHKWSDNKVPFVTFPSCNLVAYFEKKNIPYLLVNET